jgi:hypothetical protein
MPCILHTFDRVLRTLGEGVAPLSNQGALGLYPTKIYVSTPSSAR